MEILKRIVLCMLIVTFVAVICTKVQKNYNYFSHIQKFDQLYKVSSDTPYPLQNFLYVDTVLIGIDSEGVESGTSISSGSGIAVYNTKEKVFAFTAGHWCDFDDEIYQSLDIFEMTNPGIEFKIENRVAFYGNFYPIEDMFIDLESDLCVITFKSPYAYKIEKIKPAKKYPKIGEKLYAASAPLGFYQHEMRLLFEGFFGGCYADQPYCFYTIPGIQGSSGSGVLNSKGQLVSILDVSIVDFYQVTGGARLENIAEMYAKYIK